MLRRKNVPLWAGGAIAALSAMAITSAAASPPLSSHDVRHSPSLTSSTSSTTLLGHAPKHHGASLLEGTHSTEGTTGLGEPINLIGTPADSSAALSWTAPTEGTTVPTGYQVEQATSPEGPWTVAADGVSTLSTTITGLTNGTTYYFRVAGENGTVIGEFSRPVPVLPAVAPAVPTAPGAITGGEVDNGEDSSMTYLHWRAPLDTGGAPITGYEVDISTDGGVTWTQDGPIVTDTKASFTTTTGATYRVAAINSVGTGAFTTLSGEDDATEGSSGSWGGGHGSTSGGEGSSSSSGSFGAAPRSGSSSGHEDR